MTSKARGALGRVLETAAAGRRQARAAVDPRRAWVVGFAILLGAVLLLAQLLVRAAWGDHWTADDVGGMVALSLVGASFIAGAADAFRQQAADRQQRKAEEETKETTRAAYEASLKGGRRVDLPAVQAKELERKGLDVEGILRAQREAKFELASDDQAPHYRKALGAGRDWLPGIPRSVVRFVNRARVLMFIAIDQQMFTRKDANRIGAPESIGLWAVLVERWPPLAQALLERPEAARQLVEAAREDAPQAGGARGKGEKAPSDSGAVRPWPTVHRVAATLVPYWSEDRELGPFLVACAKVGWDDDLPRIVRMTSGAIGRRKAKPSGAGTPTASPQASSA